MKSWKMNFIPLYYSGHNKRGFAKCLIIGEPNRNGITFV